VTHCGFVKLLVALMVYFTATAPNTTRLICPAAKRMDWIPGGVAG
jgi:hypothetical protein